FRDAIPGQTGWSTILAMSDDQGVFPLDPILGKILLVPSADERSLDYVYINLSRAAHVTVGQIVAMYGIPCRLSIYPRTPILVLHYPLLHVQVTLPEARLSLDSAVSEIILGDTYFRAMSPSDSCKSIATSSQEDPVQRPWRGFASMQRYLKVN